MSYFLISELEKHINSLKNSNSKSSSIEEIKKILRDLSVGIGTDKRQRNTLLPLLCDLSLITKGQLLPDIRHVKERIRRDRRQIAEYFYASHNKLGDKGIDCINFDYELEVCRLPSGTTLYQWCVPLIDMYSPNRDRRNEPLKSYMDAKGYNIHIGNYYSPRMVDIDLLGAFEAVDVFIGEEFVGTGARNLYRFQLPFEADCLISIAGRAADTWSAYWSGNQGGISCSGGAVQYFIPIPDYKKTLLARTGENIH